ncbi:MAG: hypothetical protein KC656_17610 [Myxococcales bacterium]|nr:hypothetical protein [Myxococcales bacterium]
MLLCAFIPSSTPLVRTAVDDPPGTRNVFGTAHAHETEHFVIRWDTDFTPDPDALEQLAIDAEAAWSAQMDDLGWPAPPGTETWKLDLFFGASGPNAPEMDFSGGYVYPYEHDGTPYMVISTDIPDQYATEPEGPFDVLAHELNHTLQYHSGDAYWGERGLFLWEATASWVTPLVTGNEAAIAGWGRYLLHPELTVTTASYDFDDPLRGARQYDAATFLQYLSETRGLGPDLIRDLWIEAVPGVDPLEWLDLRVEGGIRDVFVGFAVSHALGEHPYAGLYEQGIEDEGTAGGDWQVTGSLGTRGGEGRMEDRAPEGFAWNRLVWTVQEAGSATVGITPDARGDHGSPTTLVTELVRERDGVLEHLPFTGTTRLDVLPGDVLHTIVVAVPVEYEDGERFPYAFSARLDEEPTGCGCTATRGNPGLAGLLARR